MSLKSFHEKKKTRVQKLYLVVHHRQDQDRPFFNDWIDDNKRISFITTTPEIGQFCQEAKDQGERIFIHRCGWAGAPSTICCSAIVDRIDSLDRKMSVVRFAEQQVLDMSPPKTPNHGQCHYFAPPCC